MLETCTANLIHGSLLLRLHAMFTTTHLIRNRKEKRTNLSLYAPQTYSDREEMPHDGCLTLGFLSCSCTVAQFNLASAEKKGDKASF